MATQLWQPSRRAGPAPEGGQFRARAEPPTLNESCLTWTAKTTTAHAATKEGATTGTDGRKRCQGGPVAMTRRDEVRSTLTAAGLRPWHGSSTDQCPRDRARNISGSRSRDRSTSENVDRCGQSGSGDDARGGWAGPTEQRPER